MKPFAFFNPLLGILFLSACVSSPPQVTASRPLVSNKVKSKVLPVPTGLNLSLGMDIKKTIVLEKSSYSISAAYVSALGNKCRLIQITKTESQEIGDSKRRVVCLANNDQDWVFIPSIAGES